MASLRKLSLKRRLPLISRAGKAFRVNLTVTNCSAMDSWHIKIQESVRSSHQRKPMSVAVVFDRVPSEDQTSRNYECLIPRRGIYTFASSVVSTSYPLGLMRAAGKIDNGESLLVGPALGKLTTGWKEWTAPDKVDEPHSAGHRGIQDGMFYAIREFRQGDSQRAIHWRSMAKLGKPAVKQFEKQSDRELNLVADLFHKESPDSNLDCEKIISFIGTVLNDVCASGKWEINLLLLGKQNIFHSGNSGPNLLKQINESLARIESGNGGNLEDQLTEFSAHRPLRGPVLIATTRERSPLRRLADIKVLEKSGSEIGKLFPEFRIDTPSGGFAHGIWMDVHRDEFSEIFLEPKILAANTSLTEEK